MTVTLVGTTPVKSKAVYSIVTGHVFCIRPSNLPDKTRESVIYVYVTVYAM